jgi:hypothetical protein
MKPEVESLPTSRLSQPPSDSRVKVTLIAMPLLTPDAQNYAGANMVYSRTEHMFILGYYFASKSLAAVLEEFCNFQRRKYVIRQEYTDW